MKNFHLKKKKRRKGNDSYSYSTDIRYLISSEEECSDVIGYYISPIGSRYLCPIMPCTPRIPFWRMAAGCGFTGDIWIEGQKRGGVIATISRYRPRIRKPTSKTVASRAHQEQRRHSMTIYIYIYMYIRDLHAYRRFTSIWKRVLAIPRLVN